MHNNNTNSIPNLSTITTTTTTTTVIPKSFGSFQCDSVDYLLNLSDTQYTPPHVEHLSDYINRSDYTNITYGTQCITKLYYINSDIVFLNHGAFGCTFKHALQFSHKYSQYIELNTLNYYDRVCLPTLVYCIRQLCQLLHVTKYHCVTLVNNATTALNSVLTSISHTLTDHDRIVTFNTAYGSVKKMLSNIHQSNTTIHIDYIDIEFPLTDSIVIVQLFQQYLSQHEQSNTLHTVRYAIFDHISSNTAFIYPIMQLIQLCHQYNIITIIDGAHACMQLKLNLVELDADIYVSNNHKWLCNTKGNGFLYVNEKYHPIIHSNIISHGATSSYSEQFLWHGNDNYSNYVSLLVTLNIWQNINMSTARVYCNQLLYDATQLLITQWNTHTLAPIDMHSCMICIALPDILYNSTIHSSDTVQSLLWSNYSIEVPIKSIQQCNYVRISVFIYNELNQYQILADAMLQIVALLSDKL